MHQRRSIEKLSRLSSAIQALETREGRAGFLEWTRPIICRLDPVRALHNEQRKEWNESHIPAFQVLNNIEDL